MKLINKKFKILFIFLIFFPFLFNNQTLSSNNQQNSPSFNYLKKKNNNFYILGPGDVLSLKINDNSKNLNKVLKIDGDGTTHLKRLKRIYIEGLTIPELTSILNKEYEKYVYNPDVEIQVINYRPVKIFIDGEVLEPGLHILPGSRNFSFKKTNKNDPDDDNIIENSNGVYFPTLMDAIRKSGGLTRYADLKTIQVKRKNSISNGGGEIVTKLNLLDALDLKNTSNNIRLLDGDTVFIAKSDILNIAQISKFLKANLNPKFISVYVGGRVENPNNFELNKSTSLNEAISIAGGAKVIKGPIQLIRYNNEGDLENRKFRFKRNAPRGDYKNPFLRDGDVIYIGKSKLNIATEIISEITTPLQGLVTSYGLYEALSD